MSAGSLSRLAEDAITSDEVLGAFDRGVQRARKADERGEPLLHESPPHDPPADGMEWEVRYLPGGRTDFVQVRIGGRA